MANFFSQLLKGGIGFLTGGWPGAAVGMLSGGESKRAPAMDMTQAPGAGVLDQPWDRGVALNEAYRSGVPQFSASANARGGESAGESIDFNRLYSSALGSAMSGAGGLPDSAVSSQLGTLNEMLNANAQRARQSVTSALGQRGMLDSGVYGRALGDVEKQKGQAMAGAASQVLQTQLQSRMQTQQLAMQQYVALRQARWQAQLQARQLGLSEQQIQNAMDQADQSVVQQFATTLGQLYPKGAAQPAAAAPTTALPFAPETTGIAGPGEMALESKWQGTGRAGWPMF